MASRSSDPLDQWREWLNRAERQMNKAFNEAMASDQFGRVQGRMMELLMGMQRTTNEAARRYFETLNVPTRTDVLHLGEKLDQIEQKLDRLARALHRSGIEVEPAPPRKKPKRTRKPPVSSSASEPKEKKVAKKVKKKAKKTRKARKKKS